MTAESNWTAAAILPNISTRRAIEGDVIALAPRSDPRVNLFCTDHPKFRLLLSRFTDAFQVPVDPVVLIVRDDVLPRLAKVEPLASFRDLVAMSVIPYCRAMASVYKNPHHISYSNSFAFYPWTLNTENEHLVALTPAMKSVHVVEAFHGQSSPELPAMPLSEIDDPLLDALLRRWKGHYLSHRQRWEDRALFRSLNMATQAAQMPGSIDVTLYDLGRITALWVSAFEILAHPRTAHSGITSVYTLFERVSHRDLRVGTRRYVAYKGRSKQPWPRRSLSCWLYGKLYQARNRFLHGSPVRISLLNPPNSQAGLFWLAPSLYRLALTGFLDLSFKRPIPNPETPEFGECFTQSMEFWNYQEIIERALLETRR